MKSKTSYSCKSFSHGENFYDKIARLLCATLAATPLPALAGNSQPTGAVTPTSEIMTINSVSLYDDSNTQVTLASTPFNVTFKRSDKDLAQTSLATPSFPSGKRYIGVAVNFNTSKQVVLNGNIYQGQSNVTTGVTNTTDGVTNAVKLYTTGTGDGTNANTISKTAPTGGATTLSLNFSSNSQTSATSSFYFAKPICIPVTPTATTICKTGDVIMDGVSKVPTITLLKDLFHDIGIDNGQMSLDNHYGTFPTVVVGAGAAVHLTLNYGSSPNESTADVTLIFDSSKNLITASGISAGSNSNNSGVYIPGFCVSAGWVSSVTGTGSNSFGPTFVQAINVSGTLQIGANGSPGNGANFPAGMDVFSNVFAAAGSSITGTCIPDSSATPPYLGYTYTSGLGKTGSVGWTVARVVDPSGILGNCNSSSTGYIASTGNTTSGTCSAYTSVNADGYP